MDSRELRLTLTLLQRVGSRVGHSVGRVTTLELRLDPLDFENLQQLVHGRLRDLEGLGPIQDLLDGDIYGASELRAARQKLFEGLEFDVNQFINLLVIVFACYGDWNVNDGGGCRGWRHDLCVAGDND